MVVADTAVPLAVRCARRRTTRAIAFDGKCLREKCEEAHDMGYELLKRIASILGEHLDATRSQLRGIYDVAN